MTYHLTFIDHGPQIDSVSIRILVMALKDLVRTKIIGQAMTLSHVGLL